MAQYHFLQRSSHAKEDSSFRRHHLDTYDRNVLLFYDSCRAIRLSGNHCSGEDPYRYARFVHFPAIAATGGSGFFLSRSRKGRLVNAKKKRMPFIAANSLLILVPAAIFLDQWASASAFDTRFYLLQAAELLAGAINLTLLMGLNMRDGLRLGGHVGAGDHVAP